MTFPWQVDVVALPTGVNQYATATTPLGLFDGLLSSGDRPWVACYEPNGDENQYANDYDQHAGSTPHLPAAWDDQGWTAMEIANSANAAATISAIAKPTRLHIGPS